MILLFDGQIEKKREKRFVKLNTDECSLNFVRLSTLNESFPKPIENLLAYFSSSSIQADDFCLENL